MTLPVFVIDLDHTLIHAVYGKNKITPLREEDNSAYWQRDLGQHYLIHIWWRPGAKKFLEWAVKHTHVAIWTLGELSYAKAILQESLPHLYDKLVFVWDCRYGVDDPNFSYPIKPLSKVWDNEIYGKIFNETNTIIIEDTPDMAYKNMDNLILVEPYFATDENDGFFIIFQNFLTLMLEHNIDFHKLPLANILWRGSPTWDFYIDENEQEVIEE